jgi:polyisoprenyl-teichoic acid--peptidoglycan teichoic acid transferase
VPPRRSEEQPRILCGAAQRYEDPTRTDDPRVRRQAQYAGDDDTLPYDRELIRSGGASRTGGKRRQATGRRPSRNRASKPRRAGSFLRTIRNVFLLALVAVVGGVVLRTMRAAAFNGTVSNAPFPSSALLGSLNGSDRVNVLMVGYGGEGHDGAYLADSVQVLSIDPSTDTTTTIPIPRDFWIEGVASFPDNGKMNEVFSAGQLDGGLDGAGALTAQTLTEVTGLQIDHWISIDFGGFRDMVDAVGGVTIDNPVAFDYTTHEDLHEAGIWNAGSFPAGEQHLNGEQALAYTRARYTSVVAESSDYARSVRQARILNAMRAKLGDGGIGSIPPGLGLMDAMEGRVRTDLSAIDLFLLSSHLSSDRRIELSEGPVLTATTNTDGQYILIPTGWTGPGDYGGLRAFLAGELSQPIGSSASDAP